MGGGQLISIHPEELTFRVELEKPAYCSLRIVNNSQHHVAFKVKTTSPNKYFVRPNTRVIQPWDSCIIIVTLQAQKEYPPDMKCRDKFLLQSTIVPPSIDIDEIPTDTFFKDEEKVIDECKLGVVFVTPQSVNANSEVKAGITSSTKLSMGGSDMLKHSTAKEAHALKRLAKERDSILQGNQILRRELVMLKRRSSHKSDEGFSLIFAAFVGSIGLLVGIMLNIALSSHSTA